MARGWLAPVAAALERLDGPVEVFFRDDDAGWDDGGLFALLDVFDGLDLPVDVAVIPAAITPGLAAELSARVAAGGVRVHQHGYAHVSHETLERKCEFGPSRPLAAQARDITAGAALMADAFGAAVDPIFTPPWNRCVSATASLLPEVGLRVLSRDAGAARAGAPGVVEIPVTVDWFGKSKGLPWGRAVLAERIAASLAAPGPTGLMLHHAVTDELERAEVAALLRLLAGHPQVTPTTITALAPAR